MGRTYQAKSNKQIKTQSTLRQIHTRKRKQIEIQQVRRARILRTRSTITTYDDEALAQQELEIHSVYGRLLVLEQTTALARFAENCSPKNVFQTCGTLAGLTFSFDTLISLILNEKLRSQTLPLDSVGFLALWLLRWVAVRGWAIPFGT